MEGIPRLLDAVGLGGGKPPLQGRFVVHAQIQRHVRRALLKGGAVYGLHPIHAQAPGCPLIGQGGIHKPVAQHDFAPLYRGQNHVVQMLGAGGGEQEGLRFGGHAIVLLGQHDLSHLLGDRAATRLPRAADGVTKILKQHRDGRRLGGFAAPVHPL